MRARVVSCLFLLVALASPAFAADWQGAGRPSLDRVLPEIRRHTPGAFYDAEGPFIGANGLARYRIKWMTPDGRVVWFDADARTGRVLGPVPYPSNRFDDGRYGNDRYGNDRYDGERYNNDRYGGDRYGNDRNDRRGNSDHFGDWPAYDHGQGDRGGRDGARGGRDGGGWFRGGSGHGNSGHGNSGRGRGGRN